MATLSSILALETPWTVEPGGLQSMGWTRLSYIHTRTPGHVTGQSQKASLV